MFIPFFSSEIRYRYGQHAHYARCARLSFLLPVVIVALQPVLLELSVISQPLASSCSSAMSQPPSIYMPSMLRRRITVPSTSTSTMDDNIDKHSWSAGSVMCSLLPSSIHSRIPTMPSLRRTKSGPMRTEHGKVTHRHSRQWSASGVTTPISEDTETETLVASEGENPLGALWLSGQRNDTIGESLVKAGQPGSGIEWRCGRPGKTVPA